MRLVREPQGLAPAFRPIPVQAWFPCPGNVFVAAVSSAVSDLFGSLALRAFARRLLGFLYGFEPHPGIGYLLMKFSICRGKLRVTVNTL
jgi:hypothetical protein